MWQQAQDIVSLVLIGLLLFWISQSEAGLHKLWVWENKKIIFILFFFFLPFENNIIKSISYEIIQNIQ